MLATSGAQTLGWLKQLRVICSEKSGEGPGFLKPVHLVTAALAFKELGATTVEVPPDLASYAARMGLWEAIGLACPINLVLGPTNDRFSKIRALKGPSDVADCADEIKAVISANTAATPESQEAADSVWIAINELLGNCFAHSRASDGLFGLVCSQVWRANSRAQIAIADSGVGVRASLAETTDSDLRGRLESENACRLAAEYGVSSKLGRGHSGYGLTLARDLIRQNGGSFVIVSRGEAYSCSRNKERVWDGLDGLFSGTVVVFEWRTNRPLDATKVYRAWPSTGDDDEHF